MRAKADFAVRGQLSATSFGLLAVAAITGVALAAGASGASTHALRDVHGTKTFWHATPAGRSVLTPATKLSVKPSTYTLQARRPRPRAREGTAGADPRRAHQAPRRLAPGPEGRASSASCSAVEHHGARASHASTRRSRRSAAGASTTRPRRSTRTSARSASTRPSARRRATGTSTPTTTSTRASTSYFGHDVPRQARARRFVERDATAPSSRSTRATTTPTTT